MARPASGKFSAGIQLYRDMYWLLRRISASGTPIVDRAMECAARLATAARLVLAPGEAEKFIDAVRQVIFDDSLGSLKQRFDQLSPLLDEASHAKLRKQIGDAEREVRGKPSAQRTRSLNEALLQAFDEDFGREVREAAMRDHERALSSMDPDSAHRFDLYFRIRFVMPSSHVRVVKGKVLKVTKAEWRKRAALAATCSPMSIRRAIADYGEALQSVKDRR